MMSTPSTRRRIAIVGGGITGLAAAHRVVELSKTHTLPVDVTLFERSFRTGGVISSLERSDFLLEEGPDSILSEKPAAVRLAERIGLKERLIGTSDEYRRSFVVRRGRLEPTPEGFYLMAPARMIPLATSRIFSIPGKIRMALELMIPRRKGSGDESVADFVVRRLGREALDRMAQPMIGGIYGADPADLSLQATFPRFHAMESEYGSIIRAMITAGRNRRIDSASGARYSLFVTFDKGLQVLSDALRQRLPEDTVRLGRVVTALAPGPSGSWIVTTAAGSESFDAVILANHAPDAARLVRSFDHALADHLASIVYGMAATVSLAYAEADVSHPMDGFGFVVPAVERLSIVGCTFGHRKYRGRAPAGHALLRAFWTDAARDLTDNEIVERTRKDLAMLLSIRRAPLFAHVARWHDSMPRYAVGHLGLVDAIERLVAGHRGLALAGNGYRGIGVPDCIASGETAAQASLEQLFPQRVRTEDPGRGINVPARPLQER